MFYYDIKLLSIEHSLFQGLKSKFLITIMTKEKIEAEIRMKKLGSKDLSFAIIAFDNRKQHLCSR